jgi:hypothetical protein
MPDNFMDHLSTHAQEKVRKRLRSPAAYEALREKVKGPEDLEKHLEKMDKMAEAHFALETEPKIQESLKKQVEKDIEEQGIENVLETNKASPEAKKRIEQGKFTLKISAHSKTHEDALQAVPEGSVQEKLPVKPSFSEQYFGQLMQSKKSKK